MSRTEYTEFRCDRVRCGNTARTTDKSTPSGWGRVRLQDAPFKDLYGNVHQDNPEHLHLCKRCYAAVHDYLQVSSGRRSEEME